jgi:hypothetical protein
MMHIITAAKMIQHSKKKQEGQKTADALKAACDIHRYHVSEKSNQAHFWERVVNVLIRHKLRDTQK